MPQASQPWVWTKGYDIENAKAPKPVKIFFLQTVLCGKTVGTAIPLKHLKEVHGITEKGPVTKKRTIFDTFKQPDSSLAPRDRDLCHQLVTGFNPKQFKEKFTQWILRRNIGLYGICPSGESLFP